ncbi:MFS transporter [bacterium]|nr:MFS transporter [bacterium]
MKKNEDSYATRLFRYRWLIFGLFAIAYVFVYFHRFALSVVAVDLNKAFSASAGLMGVLGSVYFYCYAFMQFPAGLLSDSLGPRKSAAIFLIIASFGSILFGLAPNLIIAIFARFLVGLGVSMVFIPTLKILSQWFRASEFAFMAAILNAMGGVGMLISAAPLALMSSLFGWRISFELIGLITVILAIFVWIIVRDRPSDMGLPSIAKIDDVRNKDDKNKDDYNHNKYEKFDDTDTQQKRIPMWEGVRQVITNRHFWPVAIWFFFDCGVFFGFGALWSGPYLMHVYGKTQAEAGFILSMIAVGMIGGSPLISFLSDKVFKSRKKVLILCSSGLVADILLLNLIPKGLSMSVLLAVFLILSICSSAVVAIAFTNTKELFPVEIAGTCAGAVNLFPFLGGAVFQPLLGWVLDLYSKPESTKEYTIRAYSAQLKILLAASVLTLLCTFFIKETFHKTK